MVNSYQLFNIRYGLFLNAGTRLFHSGDNRTAYYRSRNASDGADLIYELDEVGAEVGAKTGANGADCETVLDLIKNEPTISLNEISARTGISQRTLDRIILELKDNNIIKRIGSKRKIFYWN